MRFSKSVVSIIAGLFLALPVFAQQTERRCEYGTIEAMSRAGSCRAGLAGKIRAGHPLHVHQGNLDRNFA